MVRTTTSPSIEPDADAQLAAVGTAHLLGIPAQGRLHGQGRITGADGVILVANGGTEERHDAVAQHLVHRALIAVHRVHHVVQSGIEELLGGFGVKVLDQCGGVCDVGKQDGHLLAFAFEGRAGG
jgi:hypothetical protein